MSQTPTRIAPLNQQIVQILAERIRRGEYPPASRFPSQRQLADEFQVSRATVRSAVDSLTSRGLLIRRQGIATFVSASPRIANPLDQALLFQDMIANHGCRPSVETVGVHFIQPEPAIANALGELSTTRLLQTIKLFRADDQPLILSYNTLASWVVDPHTSAAIVADPSLSEPIFRFLEQHCGQRIQYFRSTIKPNLARHCPVAQLELEPSTPIFIIDEIGYNQNDLPVMHSMQYLTGGRMDFELIRRRPAERDY